MKRLILFGVLAAAVAYFSLNCCNKHNAELFTYPEYTIWGKSKPDTAITPFTVKVDPKDVEDLKQRLARWRRHEHLEGVGRSYGMNGEILEKLVKYWREKYDFTKFESKLNSLPQFTTVIQGLKVHFLHVKGDAKAKKRVPLLLMHGWPGSVLEFYRAIPLLTAVGEDGTAFDVVAPSIPGFGFSEAAAKPGFSPIAAAQVSHALMKRLGYDKFIYQGGDWGAAIGNVLVRIYPESIIGLHINLMSIPTGTTCQILHLVAAKIAPNLFISESDIPKLNKFSPTHLLEESGYFHEQGTKPDTIGVALSDSPVGLAAWIVEKMESIVENAEFKGDKGGISNDDVLTNIMVYWFSNHATSAGRIYKEFVQANKEVLAWGNQPLKVPSGVTCYPFEFACSPKAFLKHLMPRLVHFEDAAHGGHFAAFEEPEIFTKDVRKAVASILEARQQEQKQATNE